MYMYLMQCNPSSLDCGTVIIGTSQSHILTLTNPTLSTLYYHLHVDKEEEGERGRPVTGSSQGNKKNPVVFVKLTKRCSLRYKRHDFRYC